MEATWSVATKYGAARFGMRELEWSGAIEMRELEWTEVVALQWNGVGSCNARKHRRNRTALTEQHVLGSAMRGSTAGRRAGHWKTLDRSYETK